MDKALLDAARRILKGEELSIQEMNKVLGRDKAGSAWYVAVDGNTWPGIKAKLLAENPNYKWPGGTPLSESGDADLCPGSRHQEYVFCEGDDTLWQGDNEAYIRTICTKREFK